MTRRLPIFLQKIEEIGGGAAHEGSEGQRGLPQSRFLAVFGAHLGNDRVDACRQVPILDAFPRCAAGAAPAVSGAARASMMQLQWSERR